LKKHSPKVVMMLITFFSISFLLFQTVTVSSQVIITTEIPEISINAAILYYPGNWDININIFEELNQSPEVDITWNVLNLSDPLDSFYDYELIYITGMDLELSLTEEESEKLASFVENGGTIWIDSSDNWQVVNFFLTFSFSEYAYADVRRSEIVDPTHPLINGKYLISKDEVCEFGDELYYHYINIESPDYQVLIKDSSYNWPLTVYASYGLGNVLITSQSIGKGITRGDSEDLNFGYNVLYWVKNIARENVYLSDPSCTVNYNDEVLINTTLIDEDGNPVENRDVVFEYSIIENNWILIGEATTDENGMATISFVATLAPRTYNIRVSFPGDNYYKSAEATGSLIINRENTILTVIANNCVFSDETEFLATLTDDEGNPLQSYVIYFEISSDGVDWILIGEATTDENGMAKLKWICNHTPGEYFVRAIFEGNEYYLESKDQVSFIIEKEVTEVYICFAKGNYSDPVELCAFILDDEGTAVPSVLLNFYIFVDEDWMLIGSATSDENGYATLLYDIVLPAGSYNLKVVFKGNEYYMSSYKVLEGGLTVLPEQVVISIFLEDHIYLLVPTVINVSLTDNEGDPAPYVDVLVLINDTRILGIKTPENGSFSFTWTPEELAVYNLTIISIESPYYVAEKETQLIFVEFSFEKLILEAIRELDYIETQVDFPCILSRIEIARWHLYRALNYSSEGDYWKAFLRIRCATCLIESMLEYHELEESVSAMLEHVAFKLATAVRYKVLEALEAAEEFVNEFEEDLQPVGEILLSTAWRLYNNGVEKISEEKYSLAISKFIMAYRFVKIIFRLCDRRVHFIIIITHDY